jgi:hypothetical protein
MFNDGLARSSGAIVVGFDTLITGESCAISSENITTLITPTPMDSSVPNFERNVKVKGDGMQIINLLPKSVIVQNRVKKYTGINLNSDLINNIEMKVKVVHGQPNVMNNLDCKVNSNNNKGNYIVQFLTIDQNKTKSLQVKVNSYQQKITINDVKIHSSYKPIKTPIVTQIKGMIVKVTKMSYKVFNLVPYNVKVQNGVKKYTVAPVTNSPTLYVKVNSYKNVLNAGTTTGGGSLNSFVLTFQKYSFYEQSLSFGNNVKIVSAIGLPQGMEFNLGCIMGSPLLSGNYIVSLKLSDNSVITGLIIIPELPRIL